MRKLVVVLVTLAIALVIGPLALAAALSFVPQKNAGAGQSTGQPSTTMRLLRTFDAAFPQERPIYSVDVGYFARKCGYDDEAYVLGELTSEMLRDDFSPYPAYFALQGWISDEFENKIEQMRVRHLDSKFSDFETAFLNRCIANSALASLCGYRVRKVLEKANLYDRYSIPSGVLRPDDAPRITAICRFLDGVAARNGQRLSKTPVITEAPLM